MVVLPVRSPNCLFLLSSLREKLKSIAQATYTHSRNLAYFVFTYKGLMALQSWLQGKKIPFHSFLAACIGGWLVFGENNPVNSQVNVFGGRWVDKKTSGWVVVCRELAGVARHRAGGSCCAAGPLHSIALCTSSLFDCSALKQ